MVFQGYSPIYTYTPPGHGTVENSLDNSVWSTSPLENDPLGAPAHFYVRFVTSTGYSGSVTITWQLQKGPSWTNVVGASVTTTIVLTGSAGQTIYATADGSGPLNNHDWAVDFTGTVTVQYRVQVTINA